MKKHYVETIVRLLDIARSAYVSSPLGLRRSIAPLMAMVPTALKYGGAYRRWRTKIQRSKRDFAFADAERTRALHELLSIASESPFHRARIEAAFGPNRYLATIAIDEITALPISTKAILRAAGHGALAIPASHLHPSSTSGSNGEVPFKFYLDRDRSVREIAFIHDVWSRVGYQVGEHRAVFDAHILGNDTARFEWEAALGELRLSVFPMSKSDLDLYVELIETRQIRYLHGFPSAIELLARHLLESGRRLSLPIKAIFLISEPLFPHQKTMLGQAFPDAPLLPFYGLSEKALFASEIDGASDIYEFEPLYGLAELVDDDGHAVIRPGQEGRLLGTSFVTRGMPFIRYDTEDRAILVRAATRENGWRLQVRDIRPRRKPAFLVSHDGERVVGTDFTPIGPEHFAGIKEFQFYQDKAGACAIRYVASDDAKPGDAERFRRLLQAKAGNALTFTIEPATSLMASKNGKRPFIDQRLNV